MTYSNRDQFYTNFRNSIFFFFACTTAARLRKFYQCTAWSSKLSPFLMNAINIRIFVEFKNVDLLVLYLVLAF